MGLIKLFTNPAGFAADKLKDKFQDKFKNIPGVAEIGGVMDKATTGISKVGDELGGLSSKREDFLGGLMDKAIGGGDANTAILNKISDIQGRDAPEVDEYKPAGRAAEWMNRLGAGLYAAGGGNPEDIYRNFRAKEETKVARHTRQQEARQAAIEQQDTEVLGALEGIAGRGQQAATSISANIINQQTQYEIKGAEAEIRAQENELDMAQTVLGIQADLETRRQGHIDRLQEMDKQGSMNIAQIEQAASIQLRNDLNSEILSYGMNPAGFEGTVNALSRGDHGNATAQDHVRTQLLGKLRLAVTDEEVKMTKLNALTNVMNTRVHARDESTGSLLYQRDGTPIYSTLTTAEAAGKYIWGSSQDALDAFRNDGDPAAAAKANEEFLVNAGKVSPSPFHIQKQPSTKLKGFSSTEDGALEDMPEDPRDAEFQARNSADLWNDVAKDLNEGYSMKEIVQALKAGGIHSESIQMTMQRASEFGYWDEQEDREEIFKILEYEKLLPE